MFSTDHLINLSFKITSVGVLVMIGNFFCASARVFDATESKAATKILKNAFWLLKLSIFVHIPQFSTVAHFLDETLTTA